MAFHSSSNMMLGGPCGAAPVKMLGAVRFRPCHTRTFARASGDSNVSVQRTNGSSSAPQKSPQQSPSMSTRRQSPLNPLDLWDPFMPASRSFSQMMDLMNQMVDGSGRVTSTPQLQRRSSGGRLPWDVMEDEENFMMRVDMPGLTKEEVQVSVVDDGFLLIKGETSSERKEGDKWASRSVGSYESRVMIPDNVELDKIKAELKDGVLYVTVPKKKIEAKKPIQIQVS